MSKSGIEAQVKSWLEGRGRWLRAGGDNLVRYLSIMLGNGDQVSDLLDLLTGDELPDWLYVERDGRRVKLIGLAAWRSDEAVAYEEVPIDDADLWKVLGELYGVNARLEQEVREYRGLCEQLTDPSQPVSEAPVVVAEPAVAEPCDHGALERELAALRRKVTAQASSLSSNQQLIKKQRKECTDAETAQRTAERSLASLRLRFKNMLVDQLKLIMLVAGSRRSSRVAVNVATEQLLHIIPVLEDADVTLPEEVQLYVLDMGQRLSA